MCTDLEIEPENAPKIDEDGWGICQQLELWFQDIDHLVVASKTRHVLVSAVS